MSIDQTLRNRELLKQLTQCPSTEGQQWGAIRGRVEIVFGREASLTKNGHLALFTVINLLSRLYPIVTEIGIYIEYDAPILVHAPLFDGREVSDAIQHFVSSLNSPVTVKVQCSGNPVGEAEVILIAGTFHPGPSQISFGSDGWNIHLDSKRACTFSSRFNPIGSMSVACLVASEAFKRIFAVKANKLGVGKGILSRMHMLDGHASFSTFTYTTLANNVPNPDIPDTPNIGRLTVFGVGAGGGACLYTLATLSIIGEIWMVDPDVVNPHNLNRYIYANEEDAKNLRPKVDVLKPFFYPTPPTCVSFNMSFRDFKSENPNWPKDLVVSTVDTTKIRHDIQWDLPRIILDAAISQSTFYVHRVDLGHSACLKCTHNVSSQQTDIVHTISDLIGMESVEVDKIYFDNVPLTQDVAQRIGRNVRTLGLPAPEEGMTLRDWIALHCGQLRLSVTSDVVLPIPFATVLPGILLAGEIIKERHFSGNGVKYTVNHDVFRLPSEWLVTALKPKEHCTICGDETVKRVYRRLHSESGTVEV